MATAAVRQALPADVPQIARIQLATWRAAYADLLPADALAGLDESAEREWADTLNAGVVRLFVATEGDWTVGFCTAGPAPASEIAGLDDTLPPDAVTVGLIGTLLVEPRWGRRGHGSRLLAATAAALRADGFSRGVAWILEADPASRSFYTRIGWHLDGTARTLDAGGRALREIRLTGELDLTLADRHVH